MILYICNTAAVGLFGIILSAAFCNIRWDRKNVLWMAAATVAIYILQAVVYFGIDTTQGQYLYPIHTHLTLAIVLCILSRQRLWPVISVLTAYLCCQLRRWLALVIVAVFSGGDRMQYIAEMALTIPQLPHVLPIAESDLCVLLSNALENALHACAGLEHGSIVVQTYVQSEKFFLQVVNDCPGPVQFNRGVPVTDRRATAWGCAASAPSWSGMAECTVFPFKTAILYCDFPCDSGPNDISGHFQDVSCRSVLFYLPGGYTVATVQGTGKREKFGGIYHEKTAYPDPGPGDVPVPDRLRRL